MTTHSDRVLLDTFARIDPRFILEAAPSTENTRKKRKFPRYALVAAALSVCVLTAFLAPTIYTSAMNAALRSALGDGAAGDQIVYPSLLLPEGVMPETKPLPAEGTRLPVYLGQTLTKALSLAELTALHDGMAGRVFDAIGETPNDYTRSEIPAGDPNLAISYTAKDEERKGRIDFIQFRGGIGVPSYNEVGIHTAGEKLTIGGEAVFLQGDWSEEAILASLAGVKEALFEAFGTEFPDAAVQIRYGYTQFDPTASDMVTVMFFDAQDGMFGGDYVKLIFTRQTNRTSGSTQTVLVPEHITYRAYRTAPVDAYRKVGEKKIISLDRAEELFASSSVGELTTEDLSTYDAVSFDYQITGRAAVPVYTFYKIVGTEANGLTVWAILPVWAFEIE